MGGRDFDARDAGATPRVAIVSRAFAQRAWPGQDPVGKLLYTVGTAPISVTVVGMVDDVDMKEIILQNPDPQEACNKLIALANTNGGTDNITAILLKIPSN